MKNTNQTAAASTTRPRPKRGVLPGVSRSCGPCGGTGRQAVVHYALRAAGLDYCRPCGGTGRVSS